MWGQVSAIFWAQFRTLRNRFPRTEWASVLFSLLSVFWYAFFAGAGIALAVQLPNVQLVELKNWIPVGLLGVFLYWQSVPLITFSTGASLQLNKIQIYPVPTRALFGIEVLLRFTSSPEMLLVLFGAMLGLLRNPWLPTLSAICLLLFVPINLFFSLAIREVLLHSFERNRFRELFAVLIISIGVIPQFLLRSQLGSRFATQFLRLARVPFTPWKAVAGATLSFHLPDLATCAAWLAISYFAARELFRRSLRYEETTRGGAFSPDAQPRKFALVDRLTSIPNALFSDPLGALVWKELRSLVRMPRFRVVFGMACVFSVLIFIPFTLNSALGGSEFIANNFVLIVTLYGLLILSDTLLLNAFGLDGSGAQIYFVAPMPLRPVFWAKNISAVVFVFLQWLLVLAVLILLRVPVSSLHAGNAIVSELVVAIYFLAAGNLSSIAMARRVDPRQTLRKQAGGRVQAWTFLCTLSMFALLGLAYLARWATGSYWASMAVLAIEFAIGCVVYWVSLETAVERALARREEMIESLSRSSTPV
jgi:ABC-2 type transport system permease protein